VNIFENDFKCKNNTVVTLGKFDGLHEGHKKLIETTLSEAKRLGCESVVYSFNQNPKNVLYKENILNLMSKQEKIQILESMGIDNVVFQDFTYEFSKISSEQFAVSYIKNKLNAKSVVVGFNFRFGYNAEGNVELLKAYGEKYGFNVIVVDLVKKDGKIISSSTIREKVIL